MSILLQVPERVEKGMLLELCARGTCCELIYRIPPDRKIQSKTRLLHLSDDKWVIGSPTTSQGRPIVLSAGDRVRFNFCWNHRRYTAVTTVRGLVHWPRGGDLDESALAVEPPSAIEKASRREGFRLSMVDHPLARIALEPIRTLEDRIDPDLAMPSHVPLPRASHRGRLLNLSETGCCVKLAVDSTGPLADGHLYQTHFQLAVDEPIEVIGEVRWFRSASDGEGVMTGMAWQLDPDVADHRVAQARIEQFIRTQQRWTTSGRSTR
jgi:hypothetical protein